MSKYMSKINGFLELMYFENWCSLILQRILFRRQRFNLYQYKSLEMICDSYSGDNGSIRGCLATKMYKQFLESISLNGKLCVMDIGANVGGFSLLMMSQELRFEQLLCIELNPNTYERLRFNVLMNCKDPVKILNAALCSNVGIIEVSLGMGSTSDSIFSPRSKGETKSYKVEGVSLDFLYEQFFSGQIIDLCKIDIEGAEFDVFLNPNSTHKSLARFRYILMEIHGTERREELINALKMLNFDLVKTSSEDSVYLFKNTALMS